MSNYGVRTIAAVAADPEKRSKTFWSVFVSQLVIAVPVFLIYLAYALGHAPGRHAHRVALGDVRVFGHR